MRGGRRRRRGPSARGQRRVAAQRTPPLRPPATTNARGQTIESVGSNTRKAEEGLRMGNALRHSLSRSRSHSAISLSHRRLTATVIMLSLSLPTTATRAGQEHGAGSTDGGGGSESQRTSSSAAESGVDRRSSASCRSSPVLPTLLQRSSLPCFLFLSLIHLFCCCGYHLVTQASLERAVQRLSQLERSVRQARRREAEALRQANDGLCTELVTHQQIQWHRAAVNTRSTSEPALGLWSALIIVAFVLLCFCSSPHALPSAICVAGGSRAARGRCRRSRQ